MGNLMLCHNVKAKEPYRIVRLDLPIYTIEELCYYLYHNLYLIDRTIMSEQLCDWLDYELQLHDLAVKLRGEVEFGLSVQGFVLPIFEAIGYCDEKEMQQVKNQLQIFKRQTETERRKYRADNLIRNGHYGSAIQEYQFILLDKRDEKLKAEFLGSIYHNMGTAYARMFHFEKAAELYLMAYEYDQDKAILKSYLRAASCYMSQEEYARLLAQEEQYRRLAADMQREAADREQRHREHAGAARAVPPEQQLEIWRKEYEKSSL